VQRKCQIIILTGACQCLKVTVDGIEIESAAGRDRLAGLPSLPARKSAFLATMNGLSIAGNCRMCLVEVKPGPTEASGELCLAAAGSVRKFRTGHENGQEGRAKGDGISPDSKPSASIVRYLRSGGEIAIRRIQAMGLCKGGFALRRE